MGETFYTVLGVSEDADDAAVRRAYREAVKECHPDVSDDPAAGERFKRLTTARDVLLDADERSTYDRLGHDAYVHQQVDSSAWEASAETTTDRTATTSDQPPSGQSTARRATESGWSASATQTGSTDSADQDGTRTRSSASRRQRRWNSRRYSRADGGHDHPWQRAPDAYQRTQTSRRADSRTSVLDAMRAVGPWLVIHFVLIVSALTTSGFMLGLVDTDPAGTVATGLFSTLLVAIVLVLSFLHILTEIS